MPNAQQQKEYLHKLIDVLLSENVKVVLTCTPTSSTISQEDIPYVGEQVYCETKFNL